MGGIIAQLHFWGNTNFWLVKLLYVMQMNFDAYRSRRVALLYKGPFSDLPPEARTWSISDGDAFLECRDIWITTDAPIVTTLFSTPIPGLRQHLADIRGKNVGIAGKCLLHQPQMLADIMNRYLQFCYDVIILDNSGKVEYRPCVNDGKVRINLGDL